MTYIEEKMRCLNIYQSLKLNEQSSHHKKILRTEFFLIFSTLAKIIKKFTEQKIPGYSNFFQTFPYFFCTCTRACLFDYI